jgi:hypothetical protein
MQSWLLALKNTPCGYHAHVMVCSAVHLQQLSGCRLAEHHGGAERVLRIVCAECEELSHAVEVVSWRRYYLCVGTYSGGSTDAVPLAAKESGESPRLHLAFASALKRNLRVICDAMHIC